MGWLGGKPYRQQITIQEGNVFADHTDFPVALEISGANAVFTKAQANGYDVVLVSTADEVLDFERSIWNPGSEQAVFYVKTDLSSTEATVFYMYYGTPSGVTITTDPQNITAVWDNDFVGVWHLEETPNSVSQDSTSNNNDLTHYNMFSNDLVDGVVGNGYNFDGSNDRLQKSSFSNWPTSAITAELVMSSSDTTKNCTTFSYEISGQGNEFLNYNHTRSNTIYVNGSNWNSGQSFNDGDWHHSVTTWRASDGLTKLFKDGQQAGGTGTLTVGTDMGSGGTLVIGQEQDSPGGGFDSTQAYLGNLDEIRISKIVRSDEWIQTTYENLVNNSSFFTLGAEEDTPYMLDDIPTSITIEDSFDLAGTRNYITQFKVESTATVYYSDYWVSLSLADIVQTTSGIDDIDTSVGYLTGAALSDAENDEIVDFTISSSGTFGSTPRDTITQFTVALEPVPVTDPYGGTDVDAEFIRGIIVSNPIYGEDVSVEFYTFGTYDQSADTDVDFTLSTYDISGYETECFGSTFSGTYGIGSQGVEPTYPDWPYRREIIVDGSKVASSLTDFPMAVTVTGSNSIFTNAQSDGRDIFFTSSDGITKLPHELSRYSAAGQELVAYVKCDLPDNLYIYYGNTTSGLAEQADPTNVWDSDFYSVYHFEEPSGDLIDSTTNSRDGTPSNVSKNQDAGLIGRSYYFNGSNSYVEVYTTAANPNRLPGDINHTYKELTVAIYCRPGTGNDRGLFVASASALGGGGNDRNIYFDSSGNVRTRVWNRETLDTDDVDWTDDQWHQIVMAYGQDTGENNKIVVDGQTRRTGTASTESDFDWDQRHYFGFAVDPGNDYFNGYIGEARISRIYRSVDWLSTEYENIVNNSDFFTLGVEEADTIWLLGDYFDADVTVSGGLSYPIDIDVFASISGTQYNFETVSFASIANTYDGQMYDDPVTYSGIHYPLISGSYYDAEVTISGAIWYPVVQDIYVSLADSVSGQPPVMPPNSGGVHSIDLTISGGNYVNTDMRLHALQIDNFFLDVDEYALSTSTMAVDITDRRNIQINTANCYFVIDGVTITSGIYFTPVERTTASGYRMYYDPPGDFVADEPIEVIVHGENVINDWLEETYTLLWGYNLLINRGEFHSWGWDEEVVVWSKASNVARCPAESADAWHIRTAPQPYKDLAASIVPLVKRKDLSAVIYPISTAIFYGAKYKVTVNLKDLAGNEMPPFTLEFTVEDKP